MLNTQKQVKAMKVESNQLQIFSEQSVFVQSLLSFGLLFLGAKIIIPFFPLPFTLQTLTISCNAVLFARKANFIGLGVYFLFGMIGLSVFTAGSGLQYMLGASLGYLVGFAISTLIQNSSLQNSSINIANNRSSNIIFKHILGTASIYTLGGIWLHIIGFENVLFLTSQYCIGEIIKTAFFSFMIFSCTKTKNTY